MNPDFNYAEYQFFPTPYNLAVAIAASRVSSWFPKTIVDVGAGHGAWGRAVREIQREHKGFFQLQSMVAIDPMDDETEEQRQAKDFYSAWHTQPIELYESQNTDSAFFDVAFGNPPYGDSLLPVIKSSLKISRTVVFLVASTFLASLGRYDNFYRSLNKNYGVNYMCTDWIVPRPTFVKKSSNPNTEYVVLTLSTLYNNTSSDTGWLKWNKKPEKRWDYEYHQFLAFPS